MQYTPSKTTMPRYKRGLVLGVTARSLLIEPNTQKTKATQLSGFCCLKLAVRRGLELRSSGADTAKNKRRPQGEQ